MTSLSPYKRALGDIGPILVRHVFLLVNGVIGAVVVLLFLFGQHEAAIFLGVIILFNMALGIVQDLRARIALETLQMLTALHVTKIRSDETGNETLESVLAETMCKGDRIKLALGDQVPSDGILDSSNGLEVSEALRTGESNSFPREKGETLSAGDIVSAGSGILTITMDFRDSKMARMTEDAKVYAAKPSPIQIAITRVITISGYALLGVVSASIVRGLYYHEESIAIILHVGALASIIVPQGLVVISTLLFAFGAASYSREHVLFQEINATEKLGRIKNLCLDKTGTLTENFLVVDDVLTAPGVESTRVESLALSYHHGTNDTSQVMTAISTALKEHAGNTIFSATGTLPFSSWRQYGAVTLNENNSPVTIFVGSPDIFLPHISDDKKGWLTDIIAKNAHDGRRLLALMESNGGGHIPESLDKITLTPLAVFAFASGMRAGIVEAINFFQNRDVKIRIISGDNPDTVRAVAEKAGVRGTNAVAVGTEVAAWTPEEFDTQVAAHTIFARILPEQKVRIIESLKKNGFTAMVGDGANDALAIKKADLGIAMFDGAPATRRLAGVILMNSDFTALPGGVRLADNFISTLVVFAGIFINQSVVGFFFFICATLFGFPFPLTPLNITLINYCTVGIPGMLLAYWAIGKRTVPLDPTPQSFLRIVMPYVVASSIIEAIALTFILVLSPQWLVDSSSNTLVAWGIIILGFVFFTLAAKYYRKTMEMREYVHLAIAALVEILLIGIVLFTPLLINFFNVTLPLPSSSLLSRTAIVLLPAMLLLALLTAVFFLKSQTKNITLV